MEVPLWWKQFTGNFRHWVPERLGLQGWGSGQAGPTSQCYLLWEEQASGHLLTAWCH